MPASYVLRFDDICPTMNWAMWRQIEAALTDAGVSPILAVVPDNQDPELAVGPVRENFWAEVRGWQQRGWTIGLHGYQHRYITRNAGIIGRNCYSEFAGLPYESQLAKLKNGMAIFARERVWPAVWVAPAHSFDGHTLQALAECGLTTVSDGYSALPHTDARGMFWIPQQLGRMRELPAGVWTVCHHHNHWSPEELTRLRSDLARYRGRFSTVAQLEQRYYNRPEQWMDRMSASLMGMARKARFGAGQ